MQDTVRAINLEISQREAEPRDGRLIRFFVGSDGVGNFATV